MTDREKFERSKVKTILDELYEIHEIEAHGDFVNYIYYAIDATLEISFEKNELFDIAISHGPDY
jgi:hypothetical protein